MLKQIAATSALIAIVAVSTQTASAADTGKFRQLVIEPAGASADVGKVDPRKRQRLLIAPSQGIPTNTADAGNVGAVQLIVAPAQEIPTDAETGNKSKPTKVSPSFAKVSDGIATPVKFASAGPDGIPSAGSKSFPLIDSAPEGLSTLADSGDQKKAAPAVETQPVVPIVSADADLSTDDVKAAPAAPAIANPKDLYTLLTGRGYVVEILKRDASGNMAFYVTIPGNTKEADLLVVDSTYTKVLQRKHITANGYDQRPAAYAPRYAATDNCEYTAGY